MRTTYVVYGMIGLAVVSMACGGIDGALGEVGGELEDVTSELISDCPMYFASADRSTWRAFDGEYYYIDSVGRPLQAYKYLPPIVTAPRITACQTNIGRWGDAENPQDDYDGGHLIGSQLGGWGGRANIVPQNANLNRGNWVALENKLARCGALPSGQLKYEVAVHYPDSTTLIPDTMSMTMTNRSTGDSVAVSFENVAYGGVDGASAKDRGIAFLVAQGCK